MAEDYNQELVYDLRQKYAEIVGVHLERVSEARIEKKYSDYFNALEDLFTIVKHKFKTKKTSDDEESDYVPTYVELKKGKKGEARNDIDRYYEIRENAITVCNKHDQVFLKEDNAPEGVAEVEKALREMEMFLFSIMEKAKMFGSYASNRGL